ncbi:hypothetical protein D3C71_22610 [compost metagenome]
MALFIGFLVVAVLVCVVAAVLFYRHLLKRAARLGVHGFTRRKLLTGNEIEFLGRLERAIGAEFRILPQVSMGAVMATTLDPKHPDYWPVRETFAQKIIDFTICDRKTFQPLLVVELDDRMHDFSRDRTRDALLSRCGLRTVRFWSRNKPSVAVLRSTLLKHLGVAGTI